MRPYLRSRQPANARKWLGTAPCTGLLFESGENGSTFKVYEDN
jgi:hypothetical protein